MGLNLNGTTITKSGNDLVIGRSNTALTFDNSGRLIRGTMQPLFYASGTSGSWAATAGAAWMIPVFDTTEINQNSCYNTGNYRFTAPITATYLFTGSSYLVDDGTNYMHTMFAVNGNIAARVPYTAIYRMRGYNCQNGYAYDGNASQIYYLTAADYVDYRVYVDAGTGSNLPAYGHFAGYLLG
jgi:hypothetical protein